MHHRDPGVERVAGRVELDAFPEELDLALVRAVETGEDVRERRLPGAVLTQQRVDLPGCCLEVDMVVRDDSGKPLRDSPQRDRSRGRRRGRSLPALGRISPWRYRRRP
jgi:hypothetical protein